MLDTSIVTNILQKKCSGKQALLFNVQEIETSQTSNTMLRYPVLLTVIMKVLSKVIIYRITEIT